MKIRSVETIPLTASFKTAFRFGTTDRSTSPNVVLVIRTDDGITGYGEACPVPAFTAETQQSIVELVQERVAPILVGRNPLDRVPALSSVARVLKFAPFTMAAVDTALLDLAGHLLHTPVATLLGGAYRDQVEVHGSVGWDESGDAMAATAQEQSATYSWLKTYAGRGTVADDLGRLAAVRAAAGPDIKVFVDVNGMWTPSDLVYALPGLHEMGISLLEQPLAPAAADFARRCVARFDIDVAADESVRTIADAITVIRNGSANVVNIGHSKLGGPTAALQAAQLSLAAGVGVMVGSVIEMGLATAMGLHLAAALPRLQYPSYLIGPLKYAQQIVTPVVDVVDGHVAVPQGAGLGVEVDEQELRRLDARRRDW